MGSTGSHHRQQLVSSQKQQEIQHEKEKCCDRRHSGAGCHVDDICGGNISVWDADTGEKRSACITENIEPQ
jgi:hypothetical protein